MGKERKLVRGVEKFRLDIVSVTSMARALEPTSSRGVGLSSRAPGEDEIRPNNSVGLSWPTRICNVTWTSGAVLLDWQTGLLVPLFKKGDRRVCSNYRAIPLLSLPGKVYSGVLERRVCWIVEPRIQEEQCGFSSWTWNSGLARNPQ